MGGKMKVYNKLVRDKIPEIIQLSGRTASIEVLEDLDYRESLNKKLLEEVNEFIEDQTTEELADIVEVIEAILRYRQVKKETFNEMKADKKSKRGGFEGKIYLKSVE